MTITFENNMVSLAWVVMFACNFMWMILSKLKSFLFNKENVIEVVVRIGSSFHFHGERDLYLSFLQERIVIVFTSILI